MPAFFPKIRRVCFLLALHTFKFLRIYRLFSKNPGITNVFLSHNVFPRSKKICVFASYSRSDLIADYVFFYLQGLIGAGFDIVFVSTTTNLNTESREKLLQLCNVVIVRKNKGLDFGSWKAGLLHLEQDLHHYD